jgi:hypothetical protein
MNEDATKLLIHKLPRWAQDRIARLQRERDVAVRTLNEAVDRSTPAAFFFEEHVVTGEKTGPSTKRFYIQSDRLRFIGSGLDVTFLHREGDGTLDIQYHAHDALHDTVVLQPHASQRLLLFLPKRRGGR